MCHNLLPLLPRRHPHLHIRGHLYSKSSRCQRSGTRHRDSYGNRKWHHHPHRILQCIPFVSHFWSIGYAHMGFAECRFMRLDRRGLGVKRSRSIVAHRYWYARNIRQYKGIFVFTDLQRRGRRNYKNGDGYSHCGSCPNTDTYCKSVVDYCWSIYDIELVDNECHSLFHFEKQQR